MRAKIQRWGKSLAVRIPETFAEELGLHLDTEVEISIRQGDLVLAPTHREYTLEELVQGITPTNRHEETDFGPPPLVRKLDHRALHKPQGPDSGINAIFGRLPGDESDEEIIALLDELS
jgi:antitoxin MazE